MFVVLDNFDTCPSIIKPLIEKKGNKTDNVVRWHHFCLFIMLLCFSSQLFLLLRKWVLTSFIYPSQSLYRHFQKYFLCHIMPPCSPLMTTRSLSVSIHRAYVAVCFPYTFIMFRETINFPLLCQKLGNYFNLSEIQLRFQRGFIFQHFKSSDISSFHGTVKWWGRTRRQAFWTDSFENSYGSCSHMVIQASGNLVSLKCTQLVFYYQESILVQ